MPRRKKWICPDVKYPEVRVKMNAIVKEWEAKDGELSPSDYELMKQAASLLDTVYMANESRDKRGLSVKCENGSYAPNPDIRTGRDALDRYLVIMKECGLTKKSKKILNEQDSSGEMTSFEKAFINANTR